ncbi:cytochrome P450 [Ktedonosporobacter rubrisoli]|nr:cytochrome P450 [Ktedonosporobacter rubrisoli]
MMTFPKNPIEAVTHPDPYPYYADLVAHKPIYYDEALGLWVAASAAAVSEVLQSELCRVRPLTEPVPRALFGSWAATIFQQLARMNDGERHSTRKQAVVATLQPLNTLSISEESHKWASFLAAELSLKVSSLHLMDFAYRLSVYVVASLLGVPQNKLPETAEWVGDFIYCIAPSSSHEQLARGKAAADKLWDLFDTILSTQQSTKDCNLLATLAQKLKRSGNHGGDAAIANSIGFFFQAYEATAGLITNTLVTLSTQQDVWEQVRNEPGLLPLVLEEVLRYDPSIQNTRRFLADDSFVAGQQMKAGQSVLVLLAAANRDPKANAQPDLFDIQRKDRRIFTFGAAAHACAGELLAKSIALAGVEQLIASGIDPKNFSGPFSYRPANIRVALLG